MSRNLQQLNACAPIAKARRKISRSRPNFIGAAPSCSADAAIGAESFTTLPSASSMMRSPYCSAISLLCVTTITRHFLESSFNKENRESPVASSSAPVGSSANKIFGSLIMARAIATLCFCPPDNSLILRPYKVSPFSSTRSTCRSTASIASLSGRFPCISTAKATLAPTVYSSIKLYS